MSKHKGKKKGTAEGKTAGNLKKEIAPKSKPKHIHPATHFGMSEAGRKAK